MHRIKNLFAESNFGLSLSGLKSGRRRLIEGDEPEADRVVCKVAIFSNGGLCMGKRNDNGKWTLPGGHADPGETPVEAALREVEEETGIKLDPDQLSPMDSKLITMDDGSTLKVYGFRVDLPGGVDTETKHDPDGEVTDWDWINVQAGLPSFMDADSMHVDPKKDVVMQSLGLAPKEQEECCCDDADAEPTDEEVARLFGISEASNPPVWDAAWTKIDGVDVLMVPGSDFAAIPASGKRNASNFVVMQISSREEITQLRKSEVTLWLAGKARDEGVKPTGHYGEAFEGDDEVDHDAPEVVDEDEYPAEPAEKPARSSSYNGVAKRMFKAIDDMRATANQNGHDDVAATLDNIEDGYWEIQKAIMRASAGRRSESIEGMIDGMLEELSSLQDAEIDEGATTFLGYKDIKGKRPGDKDYERMDDIMMKANGSDAKALQLAKIMANAIARGGSKASREKAHRRARAAMDVFPGELGKQIAKMFMDAAEVKTESAHQG